MATKTCVAMSAIVVASLAACATSNEVGPCIELSVQKGGPQWNAVCWVQGAARPDVFLGQALGGPALTSGPDAVIAAAIRSVTDVAVGEVAQVTIDAWTYAVVSRGRSQGNNLYTLRIVPPTQVRLVDAPDAVQEVVKAVRSRFGVNSGSIQFVGAAIGDLTAVVIGWDGTHVTKVEWEHVRPGH